MIYRHKKSGKLYRFLFPTFDATNQKDWCVYVCLETGTLFSRDGVEFAKKFEFVDYTQYKIIPKEKKK